MNALFAIERIPLIPSLALCEDNMYVRYYLSTRQNSCFEAFGLWLRADCTPTLPDMKSLIAMLGRSSGQGESRSAKIAKY